MKKLLFGVEIYDDEFKRMKQLVRRYNRQKVSNKKRLRSLFYAIYNYPFVIYNREVWRQAQRVDSIILKAFEK